MKNLFNHKYFGIAYFFASFFLLGFFYFGTRHGMLVDDGINGLLVLQDVELAEFSSSYGTNCFYHSFWFVLFALFKICGTNTFLWYCFFAGMHALNTVLIFRFFTKLYRLWKVNSSPQQIAFGGSLLFLLSPFMCENIAWTATHHYALSLCYFLIISIWLIKIFSNNIPKKYFVYIIILYVISLTTHEISFFFPIVWVIIFVASKKITAISLSIRSFFSKIILPLSTLCIIYIIILHSLKGIWIPHYFKGEYSPSLVDFYSNFNQHLAKFLFHVHLGDLAVRDFFKENLLSSFGFTAALVGLFFLPIVIVKIIFKGQQAYITGALIGIAIVFIIPVLHVQFAGFFRFENERYLYFFSVFAYPFIVYIFSLFSNKKLGFATFALFLAFQVQALISVSTDKKEAAHYFKNYTNNYTSSKGRSFIFNMPYTFKDHRLFYYADGLSNVIKYKTGNNDSNIHNIMGVVTNTSKDSFYTKKLSDSVYEFRTLSPGEWLLYNGYGAYTYETPNYTCTMGEWGLITLQIKNYRASDRVLYFEDLKYKKIN